METALSVCIGLGLSAACGFRIFVPLLLMSVAGRLEYLSLAPSFDWIASTPALIAFAVATGLGDRCLLHPVVGQPPRYGCLAGRSRGWRRHNRVGRDRGRSFSQMDIGRHCGGRSSGLVSDLDDGNSAGIDHGHRRDRESVALDPGRGHLSSALDLVDRRADRGFHSGYDSALSGLPVRSSTSARSG